MTNGNPLDTGYTIQLTIPIELDVSGLTSVSMRGGSYSVSNFTISGRLVTIKKVNSGFIEGGTIGYVTLGMLGIGGTTKVSGSFLVSMVDSSGLVVESMTTGTATLKPMAGTINVANVTAS